MTEPAIFDFKAIADRLKDPSNDNGEPEYCERCENGGWIECYSTHPPAFEVCPDCYNPENHPCP
jgi:hypothetical protein